MVKQKHQTGHQLHRPSKTHGNHHEIMGFPTSLGAELTMEKLATSASSASIHSLAAIFRDFPGVFLVHLGDVWEVLYPAASSETPPPPPPPPLRHTHPLSHTTLSHT